MKNDFIHQVYFWLKDPSSISDRDKLVAGLVKLSGVKTIKDFHIGVPADTNRPVIDSSYAVSSLLIFANGEDQASYQIDPMHLEFIATCKELWSKVIVYDTESAIA